MARRVVVAFVWLWLVPFGAGAAEWRVDDALSTIAFDYVINGTEGEGVFPTFAGSGRFDPAAPEDSSLELEIVTGELDLGTMVASAFARGSGWFDVEEHPAGTFRLDRITALDDGRWQAEGSLSLRGITQPLRAELTLDLDQGRARAVGETMIDRTAFGIGRGATAVMVAVGEMIRVRFDLVALAAPAE